MELNEMQNFEKDSFELGQMFMLKSIVELLQIELQKLMGNENE